MTSHLVIGAIIVFGEDIFTESFTCLYGSSGRGCCIENTCRWLCASSGRGRESIGYINDFVGKIAFIFLLINDVPTNFGRYVFNNAGFIRKVCIA